MFDIGGGELLLIVMAILLLFGPKKIPELAQMFGKGLAQFRKAQTEFQRNINAVNDEIHQHTMAVEQSVHSTVPMFRASDTPTETPFDIASEDDMQTENDGAIHDHTGVSSIPQHTPQEQSVSDGVPPIVIRPADHSIARS
jgi:sec-independent protein translocase protein TatA